MGNAEQKIVRGLRQGNAEAFAAFVDTHGPAIHRLTRRYTVSEADAEDLTQEIFVALVQAVAGYRGEAKLSTWVYRIALNHCLKHFQRRRPDSVPLDDDLPKQMSQGKDSPHQSATRRELGERIDTALSTLSEGHRDVVILHELHGLTYAECAAALDIPVGTVKSRLSNAFGRLRERLSAYVLGDEETSHVPLNPVTGRGKPAAVVAGVKGDHHA